MPVGGNSAVDAIWAQLKQQQSCNKDETRLESLWKHLQSGSCSKQPSSKQGAQHQRQQKQHTTGSSIPQPSSSSQPAPDASKHHLQDGAAVSQLVLALQSLDATVKTALQQLQAVISAQTATNSLPTSKLCKALLRCFENRAEACRDMTVSCCTGLLQADPDASLGLLPYTLPVLVERLQCDEAHNPAEPSEEVRLKLVQLLALIMDQAGSAIAAYASEVWSILTAVLVDSFHEVAMLGCRVSQQLAGILGLRLGATSKELVAALLPLTTHKRYRVRIAAIEAIRDVTHQGAHEMILEMVAWRDPNLVPIKAFYGDDLKVNFCGKLATDHHVQVRLAFLDMVGNWLLTLRERRDHEARLLPYVLSGVCDEAPAVVAAALQLLEQLGQQYEQEREADLADTLRFAGQLESGAEARLLQLIQAGRICYAGSWEACLGEQHGPTAAQLTDLDCAIQQVVQQSRVRGQASVVSTCPPPPAAAAAGGDGAAAEQPAQQQPQQQPFALPGPLQQRARLGSRLLVRGTFSSLLPALCRELSSWQSCPRAMSARLLLVGLLLVEAAAEQYLQVILPALCAAVCDPEAGAAVKACATVLGCFCPLPRLLDLWGPRMEDWAGVPQRQAGGLLLLAAVLRGAAPLQQVSGHGPKLLRLLLDLGLADSQDGSIKAAMTQVAQQLLEPHTLQQLLADGSGQVPAEGASADTPPGSGDYLLPAAVDEGFSASTKSLLAELLAPLLTTDPVHHVAGCEGDGAC